jgi:UDP-perosamine 4-acetyltransferase
MNLVIVGAGGHAKVVIEVFRALGGFRLVGLVDPAPPGGTVLGLPVLGGDEMLPALRREGVEAAFVALGHNRVRQRIGAELAGLGYALPVAVHPSALVSPSARIGAGAVVMARAVVGTETEVGDLAIVNTGAVIDHDNVIGAAAHVAPGCALAGVVRVGERSLVGVGSAVRPGIRIGADVTVGAGSAVVADVPDGLRVGGAPARPLRPAGAPRLG